MAAVKTVDLSCSYGSRQVLKRVNLEVDPGEAVAITGRSGSGKTTLAYCLTGIIPYRVRAEVSGRIYVDGIDAEKSGFEELVKHVNIVLEDYEAQIFGLTVEEDIVFGLENIGLSPDEVSRRLEWAVSVAGLKDKRKAPVSSLSGGQKQRLAITSTVVLKPKVLILDNPTSNLDWSGVKQLSRLVRTLKADGCAVILMLRKLKGVEDSVDRIYRLEDGELKGIERYVEALSVLVRKTHTIRRRRPLAEVRNIWFTYGDEYVLKSVSLEVYGGEVLAVMGCNGSGKTTLMKLISGLLKPVRGSVTICGRDTRQLSASETARLVGLAFQDPSKHLFAETVWDEVSFTCRILGLPLENAERAIRMLRLEGVRDRPTYRLSMGERVRTVIASALAQDPEILLLDEPTTGQDEELLVELADIIGRVKADGKAVVVVTHDTDFALAVADRVVVLSGGRVIRDGPVEKILRDPGVVEEAGLEPPSTRAEVMDGVSMRACSG